jgi:environmental stress-induced protein Ves
MQIQIIPANIFFRKTWSGGTSTELFIYPPTADYTKKDFQFRLSTATVEVETSEFTELPGIFRKIMILEGETELIHENQYSKLLRKFDTDNFKGDWKTKSIGSCVDFNLMTKSDFTGDLKSLTLEVEQTLHYPLKNKCRFFFFYLYTGKIEIKINDLCQTLEKGDLLVFTDPGFAHFSILGLDDAEIVMVKIG